MSDRVRKHRQPKLRCPFCGDYDSLVLPKWLTQPSDGSVYRRVRACQGCGTEYATIEKIDAPQHVVDRRA